MDTPEEKKAEPEKTAAVKPGQTTVSADLWKRMQVILSQATPVKYVFRGPDVSIFGGTKKEQDFVENPGLYDRLNTQVDLLKKLYTTFPPDVQEQFPKVLLAQLDNRTASVIAHTLVELHYVNALREWSKIDEVGLTFWRAIAEKLRYEHWLFSPDDLQHVFKGMGGIYTTAIAKMSSAGRDTLSKEYQEGNRARYTLDDVIRPITRRVEYVRLKAELLSVQNPALDTDRRELLSRLEVLGFSKKLSEALDEIDRKLMGAATAFDFKTAMELLRTFFEEFIEEAAHKVSKKSTVEFPTAEKLNHFSTYKDYLRNSTIIGREEEELLQKLYNYLSNMGSHVLGSTREQFHVSRTTVVEWCMMIAGRVQSYLSAPPRPQESVAPE